MSDYFCQWCYDKGLRYPAGGKPWGHAIECPFRPASQTMSESQTPSGYRYTVFYGGGLGPDVWDAERVVYAVDIKDALAQCGDITDDGAWIISVEQIDYPQPTTKEQLAKVESELTATRARLAELEGIANRLYGGIGCKCDGKRDFCSSCVELMDAYEAYKEGKK